MMSNGLAMRIAESVGVPVSSVELLPGGGVRMVARSSVSEEDAQKLLTALEACSMPGQTYEVTIGTEPMHKWTKKVPPTHMMTPAKAALVQEAKEAERRFEEAHRERVERERACELAELSEKFHAEVDEALGGKP